MKKALVAGLLLLAMLAGSFINIRYLDGLTGAVIQETELSRARCREGDLPGAEAKMLDAARIWAGAEIYTGIFLRQGEEDRIEESLWDVLEGLRAGETDRSEIAFDRLEDRLRSTAAMEHISWHSVF